MKPVIFLIVLIQELKGKELDIGERANRARHNQGCKNS